MESVCLREHEWNERDNELANFFLHNLLLMPNIFIIFIFLVFSENAFYQTKSCTNGDILEMTHLGRKH